MSVSQRLTVLLPLENKVKQVNRVSGDELRKLLDALLTTVMKIMTLHLGAS